VFRLANWHYNTHIFDLLKHEPSTPIYKFKGQPLQTKRVENSNANWFENMCLNEDKRQA